MSRFLLFIDIEHYLSVMAEIEIRLICLSFFKRELERSGKNVSPHKKEFYTFMSISEESKGHEFCVLEYALTKLQDLTFIGTFIFFFGIGYYTYRYIYSVNH